MKNIQNVRAFRIAYLSATNNRNARVSITDIRRDKRIIIPFDYKANSSIEVAVAHLKKNKIKIVEKFTTRTYDYLISNDFETEMRA